MMRARWRAEAGVALLAIVIVAAAVPLYFAFIPNHVHTDPAAVPSKTADVDARSHAAAVEKARRLARVLLVEENLPGLSVAVAADGAIVWAEGFGYADL